MLETNFLNIYTRFKLESYKKIFARLDDQPTALSAVEIFSVEVIYALRNPTVQEFANFIGISSPNATYKVNSLIKKGYINKIRSKTDKREFHLEVSEKFSENYGLTYDYTKIISERIRQHFTQEEVEKIDKYIDIIVNDLMYESEVEQKR